MNDDEDELARLQRIVRSSNQLKRRYANSVALGIDQGDSHAWTSGHGADVRVTVNTDWSQGVSDDRLKATLYHESVHTAQRKRRGFMAASTRAQREFHAHTEELRKARKHDLYTPRELRKKHAKIDKYYQAVIDEGSGLGIFDEQYRRIQNGQMPAKISTKQLHRAIRRG